MNYVGTLSDFRFAAVGTYVPRQCGIATFSHDLCQAICQELHDERACHFVTVNDKPEGYPYSSRVRFEIRQEQPADYKLAADFINIRNFDLLLVQHEFGIFGGDAGGHLLAMLRDVSMPVVTTMHTVLRQPNDSQRKITRELVEVSDRVVVMARRAEAMLREIYRVPPEKIVVIPHGIPDLPFVDAAFYKDQFGVEGCLVLLTFGLLSPGKGVEHVIRALPKLVPSHPNLTYIVLGATHPHVKRQSGEQYRHELQRLAERLGVLEHVLFENRYVDLDELCQFLGAADVYVTPYLGAEQIVSGTLAYALGAGKAVVSTPYSYAEEMLADGRGRLVPFEDPDAIAREIGWLLEHEVERQAMRKRAYLFLRNAVWCEVARSYLDVFQDVRRQPLVKRLTAKPRLVSKTSVLYAVPELKIDHLRRLTDDVGILQHAHYTVPDRNHGYTTDDNARALLFALQAYRLLQAPDVLELAGTYLSYLQYAFNRDNHRFRNFMSYDRRWLEEVGSEDSHGRALWALGMAVADAPMVGLRAAAVDLFEHALRAVESFTSPRAWAFTLIGIHGYLRRYSGDSDARRVRETLGNRLYELFQKNATDDWPWPEDKLTYANAKLPHALLMCGQWMQRGDMTDMGLRSLEWLLEVKRGPDGTLSLVGNQGWYPRQGEPAHFDQQPIDAHALLEACIEAYHVTGSDRWLVEARRCLDWFLGKNPVNKSLYDYETGGCRDGLQPCGVNENEGAESTLAWLLSLLAIRSLGLASKFEQPSNQRELAEAVA
jgi:glycosyltransferase involved in cell wall biosynthesis